MLPLLLVIQLQTPASHLLNLPSVGIDSSKSHEVTREQRLRAIEDELRQLNQRQKASETEQQKLHDRASPSRLDCYPLFPPVSGYPPGLNSISCH